MSSCSFSGSASARSWHLGGILVGVEQLPALGGVARPHVGGGGRDRGGLPALVPDRPGAAHRVELRLLVRGRRGVVQGGVETDALERDLGVALDDLRHLDPEQRVDGRHDVDGMHVLAAQAGGGDPGRPRDDHRVGGAALEVRVPLPQLERGVERPRPPGRVMVVRRRAAQVLKMGQIGLDAVRDPVEVFVLVDRSVRAALTGGPVVRHQDDDRVIELPALLQVIQQPPDLVVGVGQEARVDLGHPREQPLLVVGEGIPGPNGVGLGPALPVGARRVDVGVDRRQLGLVGDDPHALLPLEDQLAVRLVAHVELAAVLVDPLLRGVMRRVARARAEVQEERLVRGDRLGVADELQRLVGEVDREVVALPTGSAGCSTGWLS